MHSHIYPYRRKNAIYSYAEGSIPKKSSNQMNVANSNQNLREFVRTFWLSRRQGTTTYKEFRKQN